MVWMESLRTIYRHFLQSPKWYRQFIGIYLVITSLILGTSGIAIHVFFKNSLNQQFDKQLLILSQAAAPSLNQVKKQGRQGLDQESSWRALFTNREQSLEWFSVDGKLLAKEGVRFLSLPLFQNQALGSLQQGNPFFQQKGGLRAVTISVYTDTSQAKTLQLVGYLRASQSTQPLHAIMNQLHLGLGMGGVAALLLTSLSSIYLTQQAIEPIKQSLQKLKQFTADASHELRNPLTRISLATEMILSITEQVSPLDSKELSIISRSADQMQRLIEDLLFLARTEITPIPGTEFNGFVASLNDLLQALIEQFELQAHSKSITFKVNLAPDLSVKGDTVQLERLFSNLLENAIKYTLLGGNITISMRRVKLQAIVSVEDTGIGIPAECQPMVFQRFWRSDQARIQQQEGLGLGLAIAQAIAKQHGGEIIVSSQEGVGSLFQVRLPIL